MLNQLSSNVLVVQFTILVRKIQAITCADLYNADTAICFVYVSKQADKYILRSSLSKLQQQVVRQYKLFHNMVVSSLSTIPSESDDILKYVSTSNIRERFRQLKQEFKFAH